MITVTDTAAVKVKELLDAEGQPELALRVAVRPGGCSGFSYEMFFDGDVDAEDQTVEQAGSPSSSIRPARRCSSAPRSTTRTACSRPGFSITNPNASRTCGCGSSFGQIRIRSEASAPCRSAAGQRQLDRVAHLILSNTASRRHQIAGGVGDEQQRLEVEFVGLHRRGGLLQRVVGVDLGVDEGHLVAEVLP